MCHTRIPYHLPCGHYATPELETKCPIAVYSKHHSRGCDYRVSNGVVSVNAWCKKCVEKQWEAGSASSCETSSVSSVPLFSRSVSSESLASRGSSAASVRGGIKVVMEKREIREGMLSMAAKLREVTAPMREYKERMGRMGRELEAEKMVL